VRRILLAGVIALSITITLPKSTNAQQEQDEGARQAWSDSRERARERRRQESQAGVGNARPSAATTERPQESSKNSRQKTSHPRQQAHHSQVKGIEASTHAASGAAGGGVTLSEFEAEPVGLGYTILLKESPQNFVRVDPGRIFYSGESVRIIVESSIDGYLYVFHRPDDGPVKLLFPKWQYESGNNWIRAHSYYQVPDPEKFEFMFDNNPATEKITIVVSRAPLPGIPVGEELRGMTGKIFLDEGLFREVTRAAAYRSYARPSRGERMTPQEGRRDIVPVESDSLPAHILISRDREVDRVIANIILSHR
jgi:hypothetical protein